MPNLFRSASRTCLCIMVSIACTQPVVASAPVEVVGLFKGMAVVRLPGQGEKLIRVGETTDAGITLLAADAASAEVRYQDNVYTLGLSRKVAGRYKAVDKRQISINPDGSGQYRVSGAINGQPAGFLVDTGASVLAMSSDDARRLGIDYAAAERGSVQTAQGLVGSYFLDVDKVEVGGITVHNVKSAVIEGSYPAEMLLGMSFLRQVALSETNGVMVLTQKH